MAYVLHPAKSSEISSWFSSMGKKNAIRSSIENKLYLPYWPTKVDETFKDNTTIGKKASKQLIYKESTNGLKCVEMNFFNEICSSMQVEYH